LAVPVPGLIQPPPGLGQVKMSGGHA
jgi:hypothetical protein